MMVGTIAGGLCFVGERDDDKMFDIKHVIYRQPGAFVYARGVKFLFSFFFLVGPPHPSVLS